MHSFGYTAFRLGPALLTVGVLIASVAHYPWRHFDSWMTYVILLGGIAAMLWHIVLAVVARPTAFYVIYALANIMMYIMVGLIGLTLTSGTSL